MATYDFIQSRIYRLLNDPNATTYGDELVYDGLVAAQEAILPWVPKQAVYTMTSGSDGYLLQLPSNLYQIQAIRQVETGKFIQKATMAPLTVRTNDNQNFIDWIDYPSGYISLNYQVEEGTEFEVYYFAHWNLPNDASDIEFVMEVPQYAHQGLVYYAGAHVLIPSAVNSATIRQFNLRVDSGDPEHNPLKVEADYLRSLFFTEMKFMPPYVRVSQ